MRQCTYYKGKGGRGTEIVTLKTGRQYPLVLLARLGWGQVALGSEKGKVIGDWIVSLYRRGSKLSTWANFEHCLIINIQYMKRLFS
jgi:hypothetical protein